MPVPLGEADPRWQAEPDLFYHSGNDFFRQMFLRRQRLWTSGLGDIIGFGNGITIRYGAVLFGIFLIRKEGVSLFTGTDGAPGFLPFIKRAGIGDLLVLVI